MAITNQLCSKTLRLKLWLTIIFNDVKKHIAVINNKVGMASAPCYLYMEKKN